MVVTCPIPTNRMSAGLSLHIPASTPAGSLFSHLLSVLVFLRGLNFHFMSSAHPFMNSLLSRLWCENACSYPLLMFSLEYFLNCLENFLYILEQVLCQIYGLEKIFPSV